MQAIGGCTNTLVLSPVEIRQEGLSLLATVKIEQVKEERETGGDTQGPHLVQGDTAQLQEEHQLPTQGEEAL